MRQWELIGITGHVPVAPVPQHVPQPTAVPSPDPVIEVVAEPSDGPVFFWSTDGALRLIGISDVAADVIGRPIGWCKGRDLLEVFGLDGPNAGLLDAHIAALGGDTATFTLIGERATVRCRVQPLTDAMGRASGTYCLAARIDDVDVRDDQDRSAVA